MIELSPIPVYKRYKKENKFRLITNHSKDTLFSQHYMDKEGISKCYINEYMAKNINVYNEEVVILKNKNRDIKCNKY